MNAFDKIAGYAALKGELERVAFALREPERCRALGVKPPRGLLLWGRRRSSCWPRPTTSGICPTPCCGQAALTG